MLVIEWSCNICIIRVDLMITKDKNGYIWPRYPTYFQGLWEQDTEFGINLIPSSSPISESPYHCQDHFNEQSPFGITNVHVVFMDTMNNVLHSFLYKFVSLFIDDSLFYSNTEWEHTPFEAYFGDLQKEWCLCEVNKNVILASEVAFLGHVANQLGISIDPSKVSTTMD
jgi:hypothetical protein